MQFPSPCNPHQNLEQLKLEETDLTRRINSMFNHNNYGTLHVVYVCVLLCNELFVMFDVLECYNIVNGELSNASLTMDELNATLLSVREERHRLGTCALSSSYCVHQTCSIEQINKSSSLERNFLYPLCFFILLAMTVNKVLFMMSLLLDIIRLYHFYWLVSTRCMYCLGVAPLEELRLVIT